MPTLPDLLDQLDKTMQATSAAMCDIEDALIGPQPEEGMQNIRPPGGRMADLEEYVARAGRILQRANRLRAMVVGDEPVGSKDAWGAYDEREAARFKKEMAEDEARRVQEHAEAYKRLHRCFPQVTPEGNVDLGAGLATNGPVPARARPNYTVKDGCLTLNPGLGD